MLIPVLSTTRVPAPLDGGTEIYRPSRDDNGHCRTSTRRKYPNFTSCAPYFCVIGLFFTFLTIRHCQFTFYCLSRSRGRSFLIEASLQYCQPRSTASASLCHFVTRPHRRDVWHIFHPLSTLLLPKHHNKQLESFILKYHHSVEHNLTITITLPLKQAAAYLVEGAYFQPTISLSSVEPSYFHLNVKPSELPTSNPKHSQRPLGSHFCSSYFKDVLLQQLYPHLRVRMCQDQSQRAYLCMAALAHESHIPTSLLWSSRLSWRI